VSNAIKVAHKALSGNLCGNIARTMAELDERARQTDGERASGPQARPDGGPA
jgi:hypothetical protein